MPELDAEHIYLVTPGGIQPLTAGLAAWRARAAEALEESLFGDLQASQLPAGPYYLALLLTPAGDLAHSYAWITHFQIP